MTSHSWDTNMEAFPPTKNGWVRCVVYETLSLGDVGAVYHVFYLASAMDHVFFPCGKKAESRFLGDAEWHPLLLKNKAIFWWTFSGWLLKEPGILKDYTCRVYVFELDLYVWGGSYVRRIESWRTFSFPFFQRPCWKRESSYKHKVPLLGTMPTLFERIFIFLSRVHS